MRDGFGALVSEMLLGSYDSNRISPAACSFFFFGQVHVEALRNLKQPTMKMTVGKNRVKNRFSCYLHGHYPTESREPLLKSYVSNCGCLLGFSSVFFINLLFYFFLMNYRLLPEGNKIEYLM